MREPAWWLARSEMRRSLGWAGWLVAGVAWVRPVSDKLGPEAGLTGLASRVGLGLSLVSDTSDRPGQQEVMLFRTIDSKARRTGFWASRQVGGGGWGGILVGEGEKRIFSF